MLKELILFLLISKPIVLNFFFSLRNTGNPTRRSISYAPPGKYTKRGSSGNQGERYQGETLNDDSEEN